MAAAFSYRSKRNSSDSDSDDSDADCKDWKRATKRLDDDIHNSGLEKIPIGVVPPSINSEPPLSDSAAQNLKRKRNNIWSDVLQDQMMSETLTHVGLKQKPKYYGSRGEESYDYTLGKKSFKNDEDENSEDDHSGDSETNSVVSSYSTKSRNTNFKNSKFVKLDDAGQSAAKKIIKVLAEQKTYLIFRVVKFLGIEKAFELLRKTEEIEESGGMMIINNSRKRTPGGVYLHLLRSDTDVKKEILDKIFEGEMNSYELKRMFQEKKEQRKLMREKQKLLKKLNKAAKTAPSVEMAAEETPCAAKEDAETPMEAEVVEAEVVEAEVVEAEVVEAAVTSKTSSSDLEDGEIGD